MSEHRDALAWAEAQVAAARDDPAARLALLARTYHGPTGRAPRHLPFRRAALYNLRVWRASHRDLLVWSPRGMPPAWVAMGALSLGRPAVAPAGSRSRSM